jgi:hypothetical protein
MNLRIGDLATEDFGFSKSGQVHDGPDGANGVSIKIVFKGNAEKNKKPCCCESFALIQIIKNNLPRLPSVGGFGTDFLPANPHNYPYLRNVFTDGQTIPEGQPGGGAAASGDLTFVDSPGRPDEQASDIKADLTWQAWTFVVCIHKKNPDNDSLRDREHLLGSRGTVLLQGVTWGFTRKYSEESGKWGEPVPTGPTCISEFGGASEITSQNIVDALNKNQQSKARSSLTSNGNISIQQAPFR